MGDDYGHEKTDHDCCRDSAVRFNFLFLSPNGLVSGIYHPLQSAMVQGFFKQPGQSLKTLIFNWFAGDFRVRKKVGQLPRIAARGRRFKVSLRS